jgi:hypothetical protein
MTEVCIVCDWRDVYAKHRCRSCYIYERKHGYDKPDEYLVREGEKELERRILEDQRRNGYALD